MESLTDGNMLLILDKSLRVGMYHNIHQYAKANDMYMKDLSKEKSYLMYRVANNL